MGYRSEWKLAIGKKEPVSEKLDSLLTWLKYMSEFADDAQDGIGFSKRSVYEVICSSKEEHNDKYIAFSDDWTKCYHPWDLVLNTITAKAEELGLDWAYVRIGDDSNDVEECSNAGDVRLWVVRSIGEVDI